MMRPTQFCSRAGTRASTQLLALILVTLLPGIAIATPAREKVRQTAMNAKSDCAKSPVHRSICMIEAVLNDIQASYPDTGGGGISDIRLVATDTYTASIAQEERIDLITYKLAIDAKGQVVIKERSEGTKSPR